MSNQKRSDGGWSDPGRSVWRMVESLDSSHPSYVSKDSLQPTTINQTATPSPQPHSQLFTAQNSNNKAIAPIPAPQASTNILPSQHLIETTQISTEPDTNNLENLRQYPFPFQIHPSPSSLPTDFSSTNTQNTALIDKPPTENSVTEDPLSSPFISSEVPNPAFSQASSQVHHLSLTHNNSYQEAILGIPLSEKEEHSREPISHIPYLINEEKEAGPMELDLQCPHALTSLLSKV